MFVEALARYWWLFVLRGALAVTNQLFEIRGDEASGETYCHASHLFERDGAGHKLDWGIRYQDRCRREEGSWRFARRELIVDWEQQAPLGASGSR